MIRPLLSVYALLSAVLLLVLPGQALAMSTDDLYVAVIPVMGQSAQVRANAIRSAFGVVLAKVTGDRYLMSNAELAKVLQHAPRYVQQYRYRMLPASDAAKQQGEAQADRLLRVQFDQQAVNRFLREQGLPVWSARPTTLVWLGLEQKGRRTLYDSELSPGLRQALERTARMRGLPIVMPLMDLEDNTRLKSSDVWGGFTDNIRRASERYLPDVILVGRLQQRGTNDWLADWTLYQADTTNSWQDQAKTKMAAAAAGLHRTTDELAAHFAPREVSAAGTKLRIRISGLNHLADYVLARDYLQSLTMIERLDVLAADPTQVSFLAKIRGDRESLERGILLGSVLVPVAAEEQAPPTPAAPPPLMLDAESLNYRLR